MATAATTLWKLETVQTWVGITDVADQSANPVLEALANATTEMIERETRRKFVTRTLTEVQDGDGSQRLFLRYYPVTVFTSLKVRRSPTDTAFETVAAVDYQVNLEQGKVWLHSDRLNRGVANVEAIYSVGYGAQGAATLPQDIVVMGLELVKLLYQEKTTGSIGASSISIGSNTFMIKPDWPKQIKQTLDNWRRPY